MSYFDNANTDVTRRSFGSKVDKTFQREGVIPVKDRKKEERDLVAESAKYKELNKKVDERRMKEAKDARAYEVQLREGYETLKDELIKDFLSEICVESLLVDRPVVECNLKNITDMVEEKVDEIGGFKGIKHIAESTNNGLLKNIVGICEATCKKVGERNLKEAKGNPSLLDMKLNKIEMEEFGNRKKEIGSETIINHIKDKVFQVVKDEQEMNTNRQEIMSEIENKVMDLNGPVQEAMAYIFESNGVEESTLFNSLMRSHYKQILQNESSAIFESMDIPGDDEEDFEDLEFAMGDIELVDEENDEEIEDMFLKEAIELLAKARYVGTEEVVSEAFNEVISRLNESVNNIRSKSQAKQFKKQIKLIQETLEGLSESKVPSDPEQPDMSLAKPEKGSKKVEEEVILCPTCGKEECKCKVVKESFETQLECLDVYYTQMNKIIESHEMALNNVTESLRHEIDGKETMVPYLQTKDCNLNNLELGYKTKYVCESIKSALKEANDVNDMAILERVVELNISSLTESINLLKERPDMDSKVKILKTGRKYLGRLQEVIIGSNLPYADPVTESTEVFNSADDVDRVFNMVKEYYVVESTDKDLMEMVMAEAIVEYTIMETFNTLRLINYTKDSVRQIARKNISYVSEGLFGKKVGKKQKSKLPIYDDRYGELVDEKDKYLQLYEKSLKDLIKVIQNAFPGCELYEDGGTDNHKEKEYENAILIDKFKPIINLEKNIDMLKKIDKQGIFKNCNSIDDVDGEKMMQFLEKQVFKKLSNFKETEGTYGMYYHKSFEGIAIFCDEDFERISISLKLLYKK